jgi:putative acetyltransferase
MNGYIRLATQQDALAIHQLHTRSVRGLCSADYPKEVIDGWLEGRSPEGYKGIAKNEMFVYEREGRILGWSHVRPEMLIALFVDPEHSRHGIGGALFEHALRIIRHHTHKHIEFEATLTAVPFYERCGCVRLRASTIRKNNVEVPTVWMALPESSEQYSAANSRPSGGCG